jgi:AhpC/TSA family
MPSRGLNRRDALAGAAAVLALPALAQQAPAGEDKAPPPQPGTLLTLPEVALLDGGRFSPADAEGQVLVLYWWASWCPFCAQQTPAMNQLWLAHRARGLRLLALSIDRKAEDARAYLARHRYAFPAGLVTPAVAQVLPKPRGLPVTVLRGRDGRVQVAEAGQLFPEDVEQLARHL